MLPLELFKRRNFAFGNLQTFAMYGGLGAMFFFLTLFLQQVAGYDALEAGIATIPTTIVMFLLAKRAGRLADRYGPRLFMGCGPLVGAVGVALMLRLDEDVDYWTELFPALLIFSLGLVGDGRAADRDRARRRRRAQRRDRVRRQQRDRARSRACCASPRSARVVAAVYANELGPRATGEARLTVIPGVPESIDGLGAGLPRRHRRVRGADRARRRPRPGRDPQPAPRGPLRGLRRRSARPALADRAVAQQALIEDSARLNGSEGLPRARRDRGDACRRAAGARRHGVRRRSRAALRRRAG